MRSLFTALFGLALASASLHTSIPKPAIAPTIAAGPLNISQEGYNLIVYSETGGQGYYKRALEHPEWPGGSSGITVGIGADLGYSSKEQIASDWAQLGPERIKVLQSVAGLKGQDARRALSRVRFIVITWDEAMITYRHKDLPSYGKLTSNAFRGITALNPHCQAVGLSLIFNRGAGMSGSSRLEMREIRDTVEIGNPRPVPKYILNMCRLWVGRNQDGLLLRRRSESFLWQKGLD